jgi:hypothetical protein
MHDVEPHLYTTVIRELIRHENDVTNHRIMWLLIGQGLIANAYVGAVAAAPAVVTILAPVGILVTLSAFVILYKSYQARGYLQFLGDEAKRGTLREEHLPLFGWPSQRIIGWRKKVWATPWLGQATHLLEPYFFLPSLLMIAWLFVLLQHLVSWNTAILLVTSTSAVTAILCAFCFLWVWWERKDEIQRAAA